MNESIRQICLAVVIGIASKIAVKFQDLYVESVCHIVTVSPAGSVP